MSIVDTGSDYINSRRKASKMIIAEEAGKCRCKAFAIHNVSQTWAGHFGVGVGTSTPVYSTGEFNPTNNTMLKRP
jgi:hypothetical protein